MRVLSRMLALVLLALPVVAAGGGLDDDITGARSVARAGAAVVSEDGGAALFLNPGGLVRRSAWRVQLGLRMDDDDRMFGAADAPDAPAIVNHAPPTRMPHLAVQAPWRDLVLGVAYLEHGAIDRALPQPYPGQPAADVELLMPHRYGGTALDHRRRGLVAGAAMRVGAWLGAGVSLSFARVELDEERHIWAGIDGREVIGDAGRDLVLGLSGTGLAPGVNAGVLIAPPDLPVELALSATYVHGAGIDGRATLDRMRELEYPAPVITDAGARVTLPGTLAVRAGARYLGERVLIETSLELTGPSGDTTPVWSLAGVAVRDETQAQARLAAVPSLVRVQRHAAVRAGVDVEIVPGFLWLLGGYAYQTASTATADISPVFGATDSHTLALGAESQWSGTTMTFGYARTLRPAREVTESDIALVAPFGAGDTAVGRGAYDGARDMVGVQLELAWE